MKKYFKADKNGKPVECEKDELLASLVEQVVVPECVERETLAEEVEREMESSNIRLSSNDDVEWAVDVIDRLIAQLNLYERRHPKDCHCIFCD